jgi:hypothetical protein
MITAAVLYNSANLTAKTNEDITGRSELLLCETSDKLHDKTGLSHVSFKSKSKSNLNLRSGTITYYIITALLRTEPTQS